MNRFGIGKRAHQTILLLLGYFLVFNSLQQCTMRQEIINCKLMATIENAYMTAVLSDKHALR